MILMGKCLITGAGGFIGSNFCQYFATEYHLLGTVTHLPVYPFPCPLQVMDILQKDRIHTVLKQFKPNCIIHLAGTKDVEWCERNPHEAYRINTEGLCNIAQICAEMSIFLIFVSSDYVFSGRSGYYKPSCECKPQTIYGKTKLQAERALAPMCFPYAVIRTGGVYASVNAPQSFLGNAALCLSQGKEMLAYENLYNSPTFIGDLAQAVDILIQNRITGIFHVAGASRENRYSFLKLFAQEFGFPTHLVKPAQYTPQENDIRPRDISLDSRSSYKVIGMEFHTVSEGLKKARAMVSRLSSV